MKIAVLFSALLFVFTAGVSAQSRCLTSEEAGKIIESFKTPVLFSENKKARKELLAMREEREKLNEKVLTADVQKNQTLISEVNALGAKHLARVCRLLKENGWLSKESVNYDGFEAFIYIITNHKDIEALQELLPVTVAAAKKGYIGNAFIASMVDSIRVGSRMPQIFGTQAAIKNNVVYLYPLLNEEKVDEWRKEYDMPPLALQIRAFEGRYLMPVLKSHRLPTPPALKKKEKVKDGDTELLGLSDDETEAIQVETRLVNLNVRVLTQDLRIPANLKLTKDDFTIFENGAEQEISFFSNVGQPFDLVLLLDFSGSTVEKRDLIKKAALRFVEIVRPADRIAVVAFATDTKIISELTNDKAALNRKINAVEMDGSSPIWDSLKFVYTNVLKEKDAARRSAIIFMTDAEDNSMNTTFADAIDIVRRGDTTIFPVYLGRQRGSNDYSQKFIQKSQQSLSILAEETGGQFYKAKDVKDLSGIYEQVAGELGQIYSLGYEPKNEARDGGWRTLEVKIKTQPNLVVRTRRGYYAN